MEVSVTCLSCPLYDLDESLHLTKVREKVGEVVLDTNFDLSLIRIVLERSMGRSFRQSWNLTGSTNRAKVTKFSGHLVFLK